MPKKTANSTRDRQALRDAVRWHLTHTRGVPEDQCRVIDVAYALGFAVRDMLVEGLLATQKRSYDADAKRAYYLSIEYLPGKISVNNIVNMGLGELCYEILAEHGVDPDAFVDSLPDPALGNGGLGRLASCYLESMASLDLPAMGYGILYEVGLFRQAIVDGRQVELSDFWMHGGDTSEIVHYDDLCSVELFGRVEDRVDASGRFAPAWVGTRVLHGLPHTLPVAGWGGGTVNLLRLYQARASQEFNMGIFNAGDYLKAVEDKVYFETVSKVLYPREDIFRGRLLRLVQEYFLVACALQDIVRRYLKTRDSFEAFPDKVAVQLNDTHPSLAVAELMRILVDLYGVPWDRAWDITTATLAYTNHTLMPEALEVWPVDIFGAVLPRHLQIVYEINRRFLDNVARWRPNDPDRLRRMSVIEEDGTKKVRMGHLAVIGSHSVNGVSELHSDLVARALFPDFHELWPDKFRNVTNGITPRQWLIKANPDLAILLARRIGKTWATDLDGLRAIEPLADDAGFRRHFAAIKRANKERLARYVKDTLGQTIAPDSLFDVQAKRIHEYKRQLLNCLHIVHEYLRIAEDGVLPKTARTHLFAGKAAPGYFEAKEIIRLIHCLGRTVNADPRTKGLLKVVFLPDYRVSLAEKLIPAADVSEQISTAGTEASGTGNMKFALNGALTIGTFDGANIEIAREVGAENIYIFGLKAEEVRDLAARRAYNPQGLRDAHPEIARVLAALRDGMFAPDFGWLCDKLLWPGERYLHLADFLSYAETQARVARDYADRAAWVKRAVLNVARMGRFSSDRAIGEYARDIWGVSPVRT